MGLEGKRDWQGVCNFALPTTSLTRLKRAGERPMPALAARRLACAAAETGARFVRDRIHADPIDWLLTRQTLFDGYPAIAACQQAEGFRRIVVLHGLSLGLGTSPESLAGVPVSDFLSDAASKALGLRPPPRDPIEDGEEFGHPSLYSCAISSELDHVNVHIFAAMIAGSAAEVRRRLRHRLGPLLEDEAVIRLGFDWSEPLACAMVSEAMAHLLMLVAEDPTSSLAEGLDFQVEQRFAS